MPLNDDKEMRRTVLDRCQTAVLTGCPRTSVIELLTPSSRFTESRTIESLMHRLSRLFPTVVSRILYIWLEGVDLIKANHKDLF